MNEVGSLVSDGWLSGVTHQGRFMAHEIKKGLNVPISGQPVQSIHPGAPVKTVALLGDDYVGMKPTMLVEVGDTVSLGQPVFEDKKTPGVTYTAPGAGKVTAINRGAKRKFESVEIELSGDAQETFEKFDSLANVDRDKAEEILLKSGQWSAFRTRPYSKVPTPGSEPNSIFVTAMDTNPLAADANVVIEQNKELFVSGLYVVSKLTRGKTYVCSAANAGTPGSDIPGVQIEEFSGPHPAGLPGTHIHTLDPVSEKKTVWQIGYQDVIAIGHLFTTGQIMTERVVSVAGPRVGKPALYRTRLGACLDDVIGVAEPDLDNARVVSGSIVCGRQTAPLKNYLGRYHQQISVLEEGTKREFLGWQMPGFDKFTTTRVYAGSWLANKLFPLTTSTGGSKRAMVPIGTYENVVPLDILPTQLLRSLIVGDTQEAQQLGVLELAEEDLALCTFVCPGKYEYGSILRQNLTTIDKEG